MYQKYIAMNQPLWTEAINPAALSLAAHTYTKMLLDLLLNEDLQVKQLLIYRNLDVAFGE